MRIALDLDGVVYDLVTHASNVLGGGKSPDMDAWHFWKPWKISQRQWNDWLQTDDAFCGGEPIEGAVDGVRTLLDADNTVVFYTHRPARAYDCTNRWLRDKLGSDYSWELKIANGDKVYPEVAPCDIFVDDSGRNLTSMLSTGCPRVALFDTPYNRDSRHRGSVVHNWQELTVLLLGQEP